VQRPARRCERQGWAHRSDGEVLAWLQRVCDTLPAAGSPLAGLRRACPRWSSGCPATAWTPAVDRLCRQHLLPGRRARRCRRAPLRGLLMGFADLVFEHDGRYGVLDYKSNALGTRDADYTAGAGRRDAAAPLRRAGRAVPAGAAPAAAQPPGPAYRPAQQLRRRGLPVPARHGHGRRRAAYHPGALALLEAIDALLTPQERRRRRRMNPPAAGPNPQELLDAASLAQRRLAACARLALVRFVHELDARTPPSLLLAAPG
jgi:exodeoxyribonuclease V beta subunit